MFTLLLIGTFAAADPQLTGPQITGVVQDLAGQPVPNATVFIRTAGPREGVGVL